MIFLDDILNTGYNVDGLITQTDRVKLLIFMNSDIALSIPILFGGKL